MSVSIKVLGPIAVTDGDIDIGLGGLKQRAVLARMVVAHPHAVSSSVLADAVWAGAPPKSFDATLLAYLSRLRKQLKDRVIRRDPEGYRLEIDLRSADWLRFGEALDIGSRAVGARRYAEGVSLLQPALHLWRDNQPLGTFSDEPWAAGFVSGLVEARHRAACLLAQACLALGSFEEALAALEFATDAPYDEAPVDLAMRAHYGAGRQADALAAFEAFRARLDSELGITPTADLARRHLQILRHHPQLDWKPPDQAIVPRLLPVRVHRLAGRGPELARVRERLAAGQRVVLHGLAGSGKSSIAGEIAHTFDGLVCWVPADDEQAALGALTELAFRIGVPRGLGRDELLVALWTRLAETPRWLLVIDNAGSPEDARWLLPPPWANGEVLVTSLDPTWRSEASTLKVGALDEVEATAFVRQRIGGDLGPAADQGDPSAVSTQEASRLARELGGLPLALEQACAYMTQTGMGPTRYLELFQSRHGPLLARGAPASHPSPAGTTWQLLFEAVRDRSALAAEILETASFLSPDGIPWSLLTSAEDDQLHWLDAVIELVRCSLVDRNDTDLRVHRLVQAVVRSGLSADQLHRRSSAAAAVIARAMPAEPSQPAGWPVWSALLPQLDALLRAATAAQVVPDGLAPLVCGCASYLRYRSGLPLARSQLDSAIALLERHGGTRRALATLYAQRSEILDDLGELAAARKDILRALALAGPRAVATVDREAARTWARLAHVLSCADQPESAVDLYRRALAVFRDLDEREDLVGGLIGLAYTRWGQDDYRAAAADCQEALSLVEEAGWLAHPLHPAALSALGMMLHEQGRCREARDLQITALQELRVIHGDADHHDIAYVLDKLGYVEGLLQQPDRSLAHHQEAVAILTRLFGDRDPRLAVAVSNRGLAEQGAGDTAAARQSQQAAYALLLNAFGPGHKLTRLVAARVAELADLAAPRSAR